ncbi:polar amino acid transport system substrate-binding protein [Rhizobium mongolense subsp. loessense]|uniref:Polar amino acid transport system substrate-binding protein n=1 Tax=Rhizobium mongolense subsp. loessense TaxID=158890 RepID=A0A1G4TUA2_9HYPH|nr:transporter substrate-binding domain-containing protein [Rhizobium mongolense]SCW84837.1 polar amino acid transport system substrate-binding protein [Rhizobium mongolense subsp. loessense]
MGEQMIGRFALAAVLFFAGSIDLATANEKLRVATEGAYPPFNFQDASGQLAGFDVDIAKALCQQMVVDCTFVAVPWTEIVQGLSDDKYDMIVASMAFTEERAKKMEFSAPYYRSHSVLVGDAEKFQDSAPAALSGVRIAAAQDTIQAEYLQKAYGASKAVLAKDQPGAQRLLLDNQADLLIGDAIELLSFLQTTEGARFGYVGDPISSEFLQSSAHITAKKGNSALIQKVNAALKQIKLNGVYDRINDAYFPFSIY